MNQAADDQPGCILDPVHWLRHATGAAIRLLNVDLPDRDRDNGDLDRDSALSLLTSLERFSEFSDDWATVTLRDLAVDASLMNDNFRGLCTCKPPVTAVRM